MVRFDVPDASSSSGGEEVQNVPPKISLPASRHESNTFVQKRKGILKKSVSSSGQYEAAARDPMLGTFRVPSKESSPSTSQAPPFADTAVSAASSPSRHPSNKGRHHVSVSLSPQSSPLFSPQFENGIRKNNRPDPFPLRRNQVDRVKRRVWSSERGRWVLVRAVPKENRSSESEIRATKRLLSYPGLVRLLAHRGFGVDKSNKARSARIPRETEWDFSDLGTLQNILDQERHAEGLPENFVWHVLLSLLKTALYLHTGLDFDADVQHESEPLSPSTDPGSALEFPPDGEPAPFWTPVVHNSINPWNISFYSLSEEDPPETPRFPHVKLGNLSRVTLLPSVNYQPTHTDFPPLPKALQTNFQAPEIAFKYKFGPEGTKSDLWSIAAVAVAMMGGVGGIARQRKVRIWDEQKFVLEEPCSDEALFRETSRMIHAEKWRWTAADLNRRYPGKYSIELRCFLERLLTTVPKQRPDTLEALVWASNYYVHWLRSVNALKHAVVETGVHVDELEEDSDTQHRIDGNRRVGGTTPMPSPSPERTLNGRAPLDPQIPQVELPNLDVEVASDVSSEEFSPGPPAHLLRELEVKNKNKAKR